jgi:hypothetical protein
MKAVAAVLIAAALAAFASSPADPSPTAAPTPCRARVTAAGHTWAVSTTNGFPCAGAGAVVRKLAAKTAPPPVGRYPGTYAGLVCVGRLPGKKPSLIICGTRNRGFSAVRV